MKDESAGHTSTNDGAKAGFDSVLLSLQESAFWKMRTINEGAVCRSADGFALDSGTLVTKLSQWMLTRLRHECRPLKIVCIESFQLVAIPAANKDFEIAGTPKMKEAQCL
jgi:hypothetical protein